MEPDDGALYARSMEFNFPREKTPQSRFSRCLELYGKYKGIYERRDPIVASRPLPFRFCWSILSTSDTIVRKESRVHRIILTDSSSYNSIYWPFLGIVRENTKKNIDCYAYSNPLFRIIETSLNISHFSTNLLIKKKKKW